MDWTLEVILIPVADVDRAKAFYTEQVGFRLDFDVRTGATSRFVQLTPPGSGCSIQIGPGLTPLAPGSMRGMQLVVRDLRAAHATLKSRGVKVSDIQVFGRDGTRRPAMDGDDLNNAGFAYFQDPDGNSWAVQQIANRL